MPPVAGVNSGPTGPACRHQPRSPVIPRLPGSLRGRRARGHRRRLGPMTSPPFRTRSIRFHRAGGRSADRHPPRTREGGLPKSVPQYGGSIPKGYPGRRPRRAEIRGRNRRRSETSIRNPPIPAGMRRARPCSLVVHPRTVPAASRMSPDRAADPERYKRSNRLREEEARNTGPD
jgi:hypothetical protein